MSQIGYDRDSWATFFYFKFNAKLVDVLCFELGVEIEHELSSQILTSKKPTEKSIKEFTLDMIKTLGELMNQLLQVSHYSYTAQSIVEVILKSFQIVLSRPSIIQFISKTQVDDIRGESWTLGRSLN